MGRRRSLRSLVSPPAKSVTKSSRSALAGKYFLVVAGDFWFDEMHVFPHLRKKECCLILIMNSVRDYYKLQGASLEELAYRIPRDIGYREITIENSGTVPVAVALAVYAVAPAPPAHFFLSPGETKRLGVNKVDGGREAPQQFLWVMDYKTGKLLTLLPYALRTDASQFVIRHNPLENSAYIHAFYVPSRSAQK
jgi:hypothetical protein